MSFKDFMRVRDEPDSLPALQRLRERGKQEPKRTSKKHTLEDLAYSLGVSTGTYTWNTATVAMSEYGPSPVESVEQEELQEFDEDEWSDLSDYDDIPDGDEAY